MHILQSFCIAMFLVLFRHNKTPKVFCLTFGVHVTMGSKEFYYYADYQRDTRNILSLWVEFGCYRKAGRDDEVMSFVLPCIFVPFR